MTPRRNSITACALRYASFVRGSAPILAIEFARRTIPADVRPYVPGNGSICKRAAAAAPECRRPEAAAAPEPAADRKELVVPEPENSAAPIIIIKKKEYHGGHHGGAWKVAYADFVTAMMALFIVLWLLSTSEKVQESRGRLFQRSQPATAN